MKFLRITAAAGALGALASLAACASRPADAKTVSGKARTVPAADARPYGAADTAFGLDLLAAWCKQDPTGNLVFSPTSIASGLGMAYLGSNGATSAAMARTLHLPATGPALDAGLNARTRALRGVDNSKVTVAVEDQIWADPKLPPQRAYLDRLATGYQAGLKQVPLQSDPEKARTTINADIGRATKGHINDLLKPGALKGIGWVLTDAMYLNAKWASAFSANDTAPGPFTTSTGGHVQPKFMHATNGYGLSRGSGWTAVSVPYAGNRLALEALIPDTGTAGCPALDAPTLARLTAGLRNTQVQLSLPKVDLKSSVGLAPLLSGLGMANAFSTAADFRGVSPAAGALGFVQHAAYLKMDEKGTEGAAATAVGIGATAMRQSEPVVFDRPYLLIVRDTVTGEPLFIARVANPAQG
jgi:serpin B